jgi:hypothetical protein
MLAKALLPLHRALILVVLAVALTATGFAHRMPTTQDDALAFALAIGADASDFCGSIPGKDGSATVHCPACQIAASADLPPPAGTSVDLASSVDAGVIVAFDSRGLRSVRDPSHGPQGPPVA